MREDPEIPKKIYTDILGDEDFDSNDVRFKGFHDGFWGKEMRRFGDTMDLLLYETMYSAGKVQRKKWEERDEVRA